METSGTSQRERVAVVGAGVAGIAAAYLLSRKFDVILFEKNNYIGGHTNTIDCSDPQAGPIAVDTGFIVCNSTNYPNFYRFLDQLNVPRRDSDMSFGFYCEKTKLGYVGPRWYEFLAKPLNLIKPAFIKLLWERYKFNARALKDLAEGKLSGVSLGEYLECLQCSKFFRDTYLYPLAAAIWSSPDEDINDFPAESFIYFFKNHGMLELAKIPRWQTVVGGSYAYVKAFVNNFNGQIISNDPVTKVLRNNDDVDITLESGASFKAEYVVFASHADETLKLITNPSKEEESQLGTWKYHENDTVLHTDSSVMPADRALWASWNYYRKSDSSGREPISITYYMNRLQGLKTEKDYFVTLNRTDLVDPDKIIYRTTYHHPVYTADSVASQDKIRALNGKKRSYFCGSYMRHGFHEDAVSSAVQVAKHFGVKL